jgi:hypothetical protein
MHPAAAKPQAPTAEHRWRDELQRMEPARPRPPDPAFTTFELVWGSIAILFVAAGFGFALGMVLFS